MRSLVARTHGGPILRAAVFLTLVLTVAGTLLAVVPVAAYYATAGYDEAGFGYELSGVFGSATVARLRDLGPGTSLASFLLVQPASVRRDDVGAGSQPSASTSASVLLADPGSDLTASWFGGSTGSTVAERPTGPDWVDVSTTLAQRLDLGPGDPVAVPLAGGALHARVRRILALAFQGTDAFAIANRTPAADRLLPAAAGTSSLVTVRTDATLAQVGAASDPVGGSTGGQPGDKPGGPALIQTRAQAAVTAAAAGGVHGDGPRTAMVLGVVLFLGLAVREGHALVTRRADALAVAVAVGARRRAVLSALLGAEVVAATVVGLATWWGIRQIGFGDLFPIAWPPRLDRTLAAGLAGTLGAYLLTVLVVGLRSFSYEHLLDTVREGAWW